MNSCVIFSKYKYLPVLVGILLPMCLFSQTSLKPCPDDPSQIWSMCLGTLEKEGNKYTGEFLNNLFHGKGMYIFESGDIYNGGFKEGIPHGWGIYVFLSDSKLKGDRYVGEFNNGQAQGFGTTFFKMGSIYTGQYKDGLPEGLGTYIEEDGRTYYEGEWHKGKLAMSRSTPSRTDPETQGIYKPFAHEVELTGLKEQLSNMQEELSQRKVTELQLRKTIESLELRLLNPTQNPSVPTDINSTQISATPLNVSMQKLDNSLPSQELPIQLVAPIKVRPFKKRAEPKTKNDTGPNAPDPMKDTFLYLQ